MKKFLKKIVYYLVLITIILEILVRLCYLGKDTPSRWVDSYQVEKWKPNQQGMSVTGNRRQNFSKYNINKAGFNSYREFIPSPHATEVALVGDSYIQGFHQDYTNSIGKKIEQQLPTVAIYEYGYAGYDFADQMHLIDAYKNDFKHIDHVIIYIKFSEDLQRGIYNVRIERLALESPKNKLLRSSKLLLYAKNIGVLDPPKRWIRRMLSYLTPSAPQKTSNTSEQKKIKPQKEINYLENFKQLVSTYHYNKQRYTLLLDTADTPALFLTYLKEHQFPYIDINEVLAPAIQPTTLIYDQHWNDHGRTLIAGQIATYLQKILP